MKKFEPIPIDGRQSFYGKAIVTEYSDKLAILTSYTTEVARIENGVFVRMWSGYSQTTQRHVNAFRSTYGLETITGTEWKKLPVDTHNPILNIIKAVTA